MQNNQKVIPQLKALLFIILCCIIFIPKLISAAEIETTSEKYFLYNLSDNEVILEKNSNDKTYIASLTKIMTVIVAIENINDFDEKVKITSDMLADIDWDVAVAGFKKGEEVTYNDLLHGAILSSGADAVNALAISISGSLQEFISLMNQKAKELHLENTNFSNVTGLYDENNYSSAHDIAMILKYALNNDKFKEIFETHEYTSTNNIKMKSTIKRSSSYTGEIKGAKTGYINASGYCLATTAEINDAHLLLITLNAYKNNIQNPHLTDTINIYDYIKENYAYQEIISKDDIITTTKIKYTKQKDADIHANTTIKKFLPKTFDKNKIKTTIDLKGKLTYFTRKGYNLGTVQVTYEGTKIGNFDLLYNETVSFDLISFLLSNSIYIIIFILFIRMLIKIKSDKKISNKSPSKKHKISQGKIEVDNIK